VASYFRIFGPGWTFSWFSPRVNLLAPAEGRVDFHRMVHDLKYALYVFLCLLGAVSIPWFLVRTLKRSDAPLKLAVKWGGSVVVLGTFIPLAFACGPFGPLILVPMAFILSVMWTPHIADLVSRPLTSIFDGGNEPLEPKPYYSIAISKRQRGQFTEAVAALREQLAKFPNDFEGVLLLANIQAENMADLQGAEITLNHFCDSPGAAPRQMVAALTQLADWHLKLAQDSDSARAALQRIIERFPETEFALRAEQRLAHLGGVEKYLIAQHDRQNLAVPEGVNNIGLLDSTEFLKPQEIEPGKLTAAYVKHLETHPHDAEVREKLAMLYGKEFQRLDLATMELAQLINEPRHAPKQVAHWLNLLANFQVELGADVATVRETLEKIVERFPDLPAAEIVRRRLARLNYEFKGKEGTANVKLGVYEQNIGLKYGAPGKR
jgi:tetratricopeptide (TPR) repeat protein